MTPPYDEPLAVKVARLEVKHDLMSKDVSAIRGDVEALRGRQSWTRAEKISMLAAGVAVLMTVLVAGNFILQALSA